MFVAHSLEQIQATDLEKFPAVSNLRVASRASPDHSEDLSFLQIKALLGTGQMRHLLPKRPTSRGCLS